MKKTCFFILLFLLKSMAIFSVTPHLELKSSSETTEEKTTASAGIAFKSDRLNLQGFYKITKEENLIQTEDFRWGSKVTLFSQQTPLTLFYGMNCFSAAVSKLKNPAPSTTASPLTRSFGLSTGSSISLPGMTSSVQPLSYGASFVTNNTTLPFLIEGAIIEDNSFFLSSSLTQNFSKYISNTISITGARFKIEGNSTTLKKQNAVFPLQWQYSALFQNYFKSPFVKLRLQSGLLQSPYTFAHCPQWNLWFKISPVFSIGPFLFNTSYFAIPWSRLQPLASPLPAPNSICRTVEQFEINPQFSFLLGSGESSLNLGAYFTDTFKVTATKKPVTLEVCKFRLAAEVDSTVFKSRLDITAANLLKSGIPPDKSSTPEEYYAISSDTDIFNSFFKSDFSLGFKYYPPLRSGDLSKKTADLSISATAANLKEIMAQTGINFTQKRDDIKNSRYFSLTYRYSAKYLTIYLKCKFTSS